MRVFVFICIFFFTLSLGVGISFADEDSEFMYLNMEQEWDYQHLTKNMKCLSCAGQSVFESDVPMVKSIQYYVRKALSDGHSSEDIELSLKEKYGDKIFFEPKTSFIRYGIYLVPLILLLSGTYCLCLFYVKRDTL